MTRGTEVTTALCVHTSVYWMFGIVRQAGLCLLCVTDWEQKCGWQNQGQRLHVEQKCFHHSRSDLLPHTWTVSCPFPVYENHASVTPFFCGLLFLHCVHPYVTASMSLLTLPLPSAQSHHTGSLFLANLSLIHYWGLFFFLQSQNKERERIFWIFNAPHEKWIISHFSTIRTGKLFAGHNGPSHEMTGDREEKETVASHMERWRGPEDKRRWRYRESSVTGKERTWYPYWKTHFQFQAK